MQIQKYAWYLTHRYTGQFICVDLGAGGPSLTAVANLKDATPFDTHVQARDVLRWLMQDKEIDFSVLDYVVFEEPPADADQTPIRSFEEVLEEAQQDRAKALAASFHDGGNAALTDAPPMGELQRVAEDQQPKGYGVGRFTNPPLFPSRRPRVN